jgi:hypothetical protein
MQATVSESGRANGTVESLEEIISIAEEYPQYDCFSIASVIDTDWKDTALPYFEHGGVNPWGGIEALLTHSLSLLLNKPVVHSPMNSDIEEATYLFGTVNPRIAAECISITYLNCTLKGLMQAPLIQPIYKKDYINQNMLTVEDVDCIVIPDGCIGLSLLAALEQEITVIAVRENHNIMHNQLTLLPWNKDQFYLVNNYWEAAGIMQALKAGIRPRSVREKTDGRCCDEKTDGRCCDEKVIDGVSNLSTCRLQ